MTGSLFDGLGDDALTPDLSSYDVLIVNSSAGKDSQAMLDYVVGLCREPDILRRLVVLHCDLGKSPGGHEIEWPGTKELAEEHAAHYGLRFVVVRRGVRGFLEQVDYRGRWPSNNQRYCTSKFKQDQGAKAITALANEVRSVGFLEQIEARGKWPSNSQRYCTSNNKRDAAATAVTALAAESRAKGSEPRILQCFGFRAQESPRRRKMPQFSVNKRLCNSRKTVHDWLPIQDWTTEQVWGRIKTAGTRHHPAYDQGMTRLSCRFCIFAPKSQLMLSARLNPELFAEYVALEKKIGHSFRLELPLVEVQRAVEADEKMGGDDGCWNM